VQRLKNTLFFIALFTQKPEKKEKQFSKIKQVFFFFLSVFTNYPKNPNCHEISVELRIASKNLRKEIKTIFSHKMKIRNDL
jgi:flagellar basal body-associated protein FliL